MVDKKRHLDKYTEPEDPVSLGMSYLFERVEFYCREVNSDAYCIYDHDMHRTDTLHDQSMTLIREGSRILFFSASSGERMEITHALDHIIEVALGSARLHVFNT